MVRHASRAGPLGAGDGEIGRNIPRRRARYHRAMRRPGTVICELVQRALALATTMGVPGHEVAARAGISASELADRDARLPLDLLFGVFDEIERRHSGAPARCPILIRHPGGTT